MGKCSKFKSNYLVLITTLVRLCQQYIVSSSVHSVHLKPSLAKYLSDCSSVCFSDPANVLRQNVDSSNLFAEELLGSLHCYHTHPVVQPRLAVRELRESPGVLVYHHLLWSLGLLAWTHLEDLWTWKACKLHKNEKSGQ